MVDAEVNMFRVEALAKAPAIARSTREAVEVLLTESGSAHANTEAQVNMLRIEALADAPTICFMPREATEVLLTESGSSHANTVGQVSMLRIEAFAKNPLEAFVPRVGVEALLTESGVAHANTEAQVNMLRIEAFGRRGPQLTPTPVPASAQFFAHNWAEQVRLVSSYDTDICVSPDSLTENRTGLIEKPRRTLNVSWLFGKRGQKSDEAALRLEVSNFIDALRAAVAGESAVPIPQDGIQSNTAYANGATVLNEDFSEGRWFLGGNVLVVFTDYRGRPTAYHWDQISVLTGSSMTLTTGLPQASIAKCMHIFPVIITEPSQEITYGQANEHQIAVELEVEEVYGDSALPPTKVDVPPGFDQYQGHPILGRQPNRGEPLEITFRKEGSRGLLGRGLEIEDKGTRHRQVQVLDFSNLRRSEAWEMIQFFDSRLGRLRPFWTIDYDNTYRIIQIDNSGSGFVAFAPLGDFSKFEAEFSYLGVVMEDGTEIVKLANTIQDLGAQWRITLDTPIAGGYTVDDVKRAGRARWARLQSDSVTEIWRSTSVMTAFRLRTYELMDQSEITLDP